jgi:hypothetical protein
MNRSPARKTLQRASFPTIHEVAGRGCNTVRVTPGPDVVQGSLLEDMGPISPELALVDPALAERARTLLPEPREATKEERPAETIERPIRPAPVPTARRKPRRWRRIAVLAVLIFAAGAASGELLVRHESSSRSRLELEADVRTTPDRGRKTTRTGADHRGEAPVKKSAGPVKKGAAPVKKERRAGSGLRTWAANVLGVTAAVDRKGISLVWKRPSRSDHVVVVRTRGESKNSVVVFRGRATRYRDLSAHSCSEYRYKIVNYDRRGHRSTGVLTSVVTPGCA